MPARLFNHRCWQNIDGVPTSNKIISCKRALINGYEGIEVDFQYHDGSFYMHHDHYSFTNETMDMLFTILSDLTYSIWIDLKTSTSNDGQLQILYSLLNTHNMIKRSVVELYNGTLITPNGMRTMSCYYPYNPYKGDILCKKGYEITTRGRSTPNPLYIWNVTSLKESCNLYYLNKKDVILQNYDFPRPYTPCSNPTGWIVIGILCILIVSLIFRKLKNIFKTTYRYNAI